MANHSEWHGVPERASRLASAGKAFPAFGMTQAFTCQCTVSRWHSVAQRGACHANNLKTLVLLDFDGGTAWHGVTAKPYRRLC